MLYYRSEYIFYVSKIIIIIVVKKINIFIYKTKCFTKQPSRNCGGNTWSICPGAPQATAVIIRGAFAHAGAPPATAVIIPGAFAQVLHK